jgi:putative ABC transport system permease protein
MYVYIFSGIGVIVLLIASFNFINMSTARSGTRAGEVGMRKIAGARRKQLFYQFIGESLLITILSFIFALIAVFLLLNKFNELSQIKIEYSHLVQPQFIIIIFGAMISLSFASGSYPAFVLSSFKPIDVLRGSKNMNIKGGMLRKVLVLGQYILSITLIIGVILFQDQLKFMKDRPLGFEKEQRLVINLQGVGVNRSNYSTIKQEFINLSSVQGAAFSTSVPGRLLYNARMWPKGEVETNSHNISFMDADEDYLSIYGLELIAGRNILDGEKADRTIMPSIINETAVSLFGWDSPDKAVGKLFRDSEPFGKVIGIVKDFHLKGLQRQIEPLAIILRGGYLYLTLKIDTGNTGETLLQIKNTYSMLFPEKVFEYFFINDDFNRQYQREEHTAEIFWIFTFIGVLLACLGLYSLVAFIAEQRTKEIGIRKVLGATNVNIINLLTKEFLILLLIANIIAWPLSYFVVNEWLQNFAYRLEIGFAVFVFAGFAAVLITAVSVSYQSLKAAFKNPVDSLKYE